MKHILEFDIPEEKEDLEVHLMAWKMNLALNDLANSIRSYNKYDSREDLPEKITGEDLHKWFWHVLELRGVNL